MTYKELAEYIMSLPAETQEQEAYLETEDGIYSLKEHLVETEMDGESHIAWNVSSRQYVRIVDKEGIKIKALTIL